MQGMQFHCAEKTYANQTMSGPCTQRPARRSRLAQETTCQIEVENCFTAQIYAFVRFNMVTE
jgi:hypothetical protein